MSSAKPCPIVSGEPLEGLENSYRMVTGRCWLVIDTDDVIPLPGQGQAQHAAARPRAARAFVKLTQLKSSRDSEGVESG